jgi:hypothetical protein
MLLIQIEKEQRRWACMHSSSKEKEDAQKILAIARESGV